MSFFDFMLLCDRIAEYDMPDIDLPDEEEFYEPYPPEWDDIEFVDND